MKSARRPIAPEVPLPSWRRPARLAGPLCALLLALPARAQVADAVLEVAVQDETRQALPGAALTLTRPDTGFTRSAVSGAAGSARLAGLAPGAYKLEVSLSGFAALVQEPLVLRVGQTARVEATLKVAQVAETVTVEASAPLVDVFRTDSSSNVVPEQIRDLPVADRDVQRLAFLTPGVQRERGGFRFISGGPVIGAGGNASQATILVDGVDFTDSSLGLARARFSQDAVGEFRVIANRFDTEVGNSAGGALSIVTKSGTNDIHGSAFVFARGDALRSRGEFEQQKADYSRQQYGFTLGGPLRRDQTHFFTSFEQISEDNVVLFRPGGAFVARADDVSVPIDQTLAFVGLDQRLSAAQQLKAKLVFERFRQQNFRVGGLNDVASGQELNRDNWNLTLAHTLASSSGALNQLSFQVGRRKYDEPTNSRAVGEFFSLGNTLVTGGNLVGNLLGESTQWELRDTWRVTLGKGRATHDVKVGGALLHVKDRFDFPVWEFGALFYATDTRALPVQYIYGIGSGDATITTNLISGFVQDDFRPRRDVTLSFGLRYDLDTAGNNPDFTHPLVPTPRGRDANNLQPRFGFSWDLGGRARHVLRGGVGLFNGRFLLVPAFTELQQNGVTGRVVARRLNGLLLGLPALALSAANPAATGIPLAPDISLLDAQLDNPRSTQATLGLTSRLGESSLYLDLEGIWVKGRDEIVIRDKNFGGNLNPVRPNRTYAQINTYTNEGRSEYKALVLSLNGTLRGGHLLTASLTVGSKKNVNDDFSPALVDYPSDPADVDAEYGRSRADERVRVVLSGIFKLPFELTLAPIYEYGSGQPWNRRLGYDFNGDGKFSDRQAGVERFSQDGPRFSQLSLRLTKRLRFGARVGADLVAEAFNLLNTVNYDVNSVQSGEFLSGPTVANPRVATVPNPRYGQFTATLPAREIQLGLRLTF